MNISIIACIVLIAIGAGISASLIISSIRQKFWYDKEFDCWWPDPKNSKRGQYLMRGKNWREIRIRYLPSAGFQRIFPSEVLTAIKEGKVSVSYPALPDLSSEEFERRLNSIMTIKDAE